VSKENDLLSAAHLGRDGGFFENPFVHRPLMDVRTAPLGCGILRSAQNSKRDWPSMLQGAVVMEGRLTRDEEQNISSGNGRPRRVLQLANWCGRMQRRSGGYEHGKKGPW